MPQISGTDLIKTLKQAPKIILTTAFEQYAVQAFELDVSDYLVKPIQFERFLKAVMKALPENELSPAAAPRLPAFLYFRADRKMVKVMLSEILYVESLKDYVRIHTTKGPVLTKYALASLEAMLPETAFLRVHRSYIVAIDKMDAFTAEGVDIKGQFIPIGKLYRQQVLKVLNG
ncbi:LytR/AlgR family response regulator transcription factor [Chitinophaga silvisoli]|uniref:DNA-binding response regulator n=1 Tax=Chitinophaga silvisoli TaxID=2291814 RepID=A0A3E1NZT3_9BACT|nr:LytTR family DNA-binding domain-containing protein [Chitinophaga silvisoli]RFM33457.1 DNA-binding response regulator [Chitinophaga silvisoli]